MEHFVKVTSKKLTYIGYLGLLGLVLDNPLLYLLFIFFMFGFIEPFCHNDMRIFFQSIQQIWGMCYTPTVYMFRLPSKENYTCKRDYILPFIGKWTVVNGGVDKELSHSCGVLPQRYAYDFIVTDDEGNFLTGDKASLQSYYCYGKDIVAPADGEVIKVCNHHKDSRVDGVNVYCDAPDIAGNCIIIRHSKREYSMIAHIMQNSINVNEGDTVKQGEIIAKCGNSGNSSMPHIHLQVQSGKIFFCPPGYRLHLVA